MTVIAKLETLLKFTTYNHVAHSGIAIVLTPLILGALSSSVTVDAPVAWVILAFVAHVIAIITVSSGSSITSLTRSPKTYTPVDPAGIVAVPPVYTKSVHAIAVPDKKLYCTVTHVYEVRSIIINHPTTHHHSHQREPPTEITFGNASSLVIVTVPVAVVSVQVFGALNIRL